MDIPPAKILTGGRTMPIIRTDNALAYQAENGETLGKITWRTIDAHTIDANHTYVAPALRGQGIARQLLDALAALATAEGWRIHASCPYVVKMFAHSNRYDAVKTA